MVPADASTMREAPDLLGEVRGRCCDRRSIIGQDRHQGTHRRRRRHDEVESAHRVVDESTEGFGTREPVPMANAEGVALGTYDGNSRGYGHWTATGCPTFGCVASCCFTHGHSWRSTL